MMAVIHSSSSNSPHDHNNARVSLMATTTIPAATATAYAFGSARPIHTTAEASPVIAVAAAAAPPITGTTTSASIAVGSPSRSRAGSYGGDAFHHHTSTLADPSMDRVLHTLHHKLCTFTLRHSTSWARSLADRVLLVVCLGTFASLLCLHVSFVVVQHPGSLFHSATVSWTIMSLSHHQKQHQQQATTGNNQTWLHPARRSIPQSCLESIPGFTRDADLTHVALLWDDETNWQINQQVSRSSYAMTTVGRIPNRIKHNASLSTAACDAADGTIPHRSLELLNKPSDIYFSYSSTKGYVWLSPEQWEKHELAVQYVVVSPHDAQCFGEPFLQSLVFSVVGGVDVVMVNWLLGTFDDVAGFVYNPRTKAMMEVHPQPTSDTNHRHCSSSSWQTNTNQSPQGYLTWFWYCVGWYDTLFGKAALVLKTSVLFFVATTLVSFTLRETQERMLHFTQQLQAHVRSRRPVVTIVMTHIVENLVFVPIMLGMIFFLIEFYRGDKVLAFVVLSLVWLCEAFSVISLRSKQGVYYYPKIFFLLFSVFHYYLFSFPFGFTYMALLATTSAMVLTMSFFWNHYELPPVAVGHRSSQYNATPASIEQHQSIPLQAPVEVSSPPWALSQHDLTTGSISPPVNGHASFRAERDETMTQRQHRLLIEPPPLEAAFFTPAGRASSLRRLGSIVIEQQQTPTQSLGEGYESPSSNSLYLLNGEVIAFRRSTSPLAVSSVDGTLGTGSGSYYHAQQIPATNQHIEHFLPPSRRFSSGSITPWIETRSDGQRTAAASAVATAAPVTHSILNDDSSSSSMHWDDPDRHLVIVNRIDSAGGSHNNAQVPPPPTQPSPPPQSLVDYNNDQDETMSALQVILRANRNTR